MRIVTLFILISLVCSLSFADERFLDREEMVKTAKTMVGMAYQDRLTTDGWLLSKVWNLSREWDIRSIYSEEIEWTHVSAKFLGVGDALLANNGDNIHAYLCVAKTSAQMLKVVEIQQEKGIVERDLPLSSDLRIVRYRYVMETKKGQAEPLAPVAVKKIYQEKEEGRFIYSYRVVPTNTEHYYPISQGTVLVGGPGGKLVYRETRQISNTFKASIDVKIEIVSAGVGFDVTYSTTRWFEYQHDIADGHKGYLDLTYRYTKKNFNVERKPIIGGSWTVVGSGHALQWQAPDFNFREYPNK